MARILIAWELGEALGHRVRCLHLAQGLLSRGHHVTLALKAVRLPIRQGLAPALCVLPAPLTRQGGAAGSPPVNYADMLRLSGFSEAQDVVARLQAWRGIFDLAQPDILVADHAPTALLAAHLGGTTGLTIGNGFAIPPPQAPWPSIRPWTPIDDQALTHAERALDRVTDTAQKALGRTQPVRLRELFGRHDILDTFAEIDHYGARPDGRYVGPIVTVPDALQVSWQSRDGPRVLAYLHPGVPGFTTLLKALAQLDAEVLCVAPGLPPDVARRMTTRCLRIALAPVDLPPLLGNADLAVGYGNGGFSSQALLAGVAMAMRPRHVEQALLAQRVQALGAGRLLAGRIDADSVTASLQDLLDSEGPRQAARAFRNRHAGFSVDQAVTASVHLIEQARPGGDPAASTAMTQAPQEIASAC